MRVGQKMIWWKSSTANGNAALRMYKKIPVTITRIPNPRKPMVTFTYLKDGVLKKGATFPENVEKIKDK